MWWDEQSGIENRKLLIIMPDLKLGFYLDRYAFLDLHSAEGGIQ